jgi:hypothetical protein
MAYDIDIHLFPKGFQPFAEPVPFDEALEQRCCKLLRFQREACCLNTINALLLGHNFDLACNPIVKVYGKEPGRKIRTEVLAPLAYGGCFIGGTPQTEREYYALEFLQNMSHTNEGLLTRQNIIFEIPFKKNAAIVTVDESNITHVMTYTDWQRENSGPWFE